MKQEFEHRLIPNAAPLVFNEPLVDRFCACGAIEATRSRTWKRCRKCAAEKERERRPQYDARRKAVGR